MKQNTNIQNCDSQFLLFDLTKLIWDFGKLSYCKIVLSMICFDLHMCIAILNIKYRCIYKNFLSSLMKIPTWYLSLQTERIIFCDILQQVLKCQCGDSAQYKMFNGCLAVCHIFLFLKYFDIWLECADRGVGWMVCRLFFLRARKSWKKYRIIWFGKFNLGWNHSDLKNKLTYSIHMELPQRMIEWQIHTLS